MKKALYILLVAFFFSCSNQKNVIEYSTYVSPDKSYTVEIPNNIPQYKSSGSFMSFFKEKGHQTVSVVKSTLSPQEYFMSEKNDNSFTITTVENSDSIYIQKYTRGAMNVWSAYECIGRTIKHGNSYIVKVSSDVVSKEDCRDMLVHIMGSISSNY